MSADGRSPEMTRLPLLVLLIFVTALATPSAASAVTYPDQRKVTGPELTVSLDAGLRYWASLGRGPSCPSGITVYLARLPAGSDGLHAAARATLSGCEIWLDSDWVASLTDARQLCPPITHEIGHLTGLGDGGTGNAVMDAPALESLPAIGPCLEAFPPPSAPVATPEPPRVTPVAAEHPARLTRRSLTMAARAVLHGKRHPIQCRLQGNRRGSCSVRLGARRCRGKVYVSMSRSGGISTVSSFSCTSGSRA
jgi:hypothetical protein